MQDVIKKITDLPNQTYNREDTKSISKAIVRIIYDEFRPIISNIVVMWNNPVNYTETVINDTEFYPLPFNYKPFFKDSIVQIKECIYPLNGHDILINYDEYFKNEITYWKSICVIPIFNIHNNKKGAIILLSSRNDLTLLKDQIDLLHNAINETVDLFEVYSFITQLSDFTLIPRPKKTLSNKYNTLSEALKIYKDNIVHFSIWKIDDICDEDFNVIKEKSQNFIENPTEEKQVYRLKYSDHHRIIQYIKYLIEIGIRDEFKEANEIEKEKRKKKKVDLSKYIKYEMFREEDINNNSCLTKKYCDVIGIKPDKTWIIYIPIIPVRLNERTDKMNILCLYVNDLQNSIFKNSGILSMLSRKVYESFTLHNQLIRNDTTKKILELRDNNEYQFFKDAADILIDKNQCESCYIYMLEKSNILRLIIGREEHKTIEKNSLNKYEIPINESRKILIQLSIKVSNDEDFSQFLTKKISGEFSNSEKKEYYLHYGDYANKIYSGILIPIRDNNQNFVGFVLFTNKKVTNGHVEEKYSPYFSSHNESIVSPSIESIYRYKLLRDSIKNRDLLLQKIRHEIPHEVNLINKGINDIKGYFIEKYIAATETIPLDNSDIEYLSRKLSIINQLALANTRIELFTSFATTLNFSKEEILRKRKTLNFKTYINSVKDIFREEAKSRGIDIKFNEEKIDYKIENVSRFYELAIHNIIFNAIRYSRFGTCVEVSMRSGIIEVINYGIGIKSEEYDRIYDEGFRGDEAIKVSAEGLGFGLFLARKVIHAHDGHYLIQKSEKLYDYNPYGIISFCNFLDNNNGLQLLNGLINDKLLKLSDVEYEKFKAEMANVLQSASKYYTIDKVAVYNMLKSEFCSEQDKQMNFGLFKSQFLKCNIYKTTFTIIYK